MKQLAVYPPQDREGHFFTNEEIFRDQAVFQPLFAAILSTPVEIDTIAAISDLSHFINHVLYVECAQNFREDRLIRMADFIAMQILRLSALTKMETDRKILLFLSAVCHLGSIDLLHMMRTETFLDRETARAFFIDTPVKDISLKQYILHSNMEGRSQDQVQHYINDYLESEGHREYLRERIVSNLQDGSVLDLGSASGTLFEEIRRSSLASTDLVGVELSDQLFQVAVNKQIPNATFVNEDLMRFNFPAETFDNVVMCSTLHEIISFCGIESMGFLFNRIYSTLRHGGRLVISDGFKNDSTLGQLTITNPIKNILFRDFCKLRPDHEFFQAGNNRYISSLTSIFEFIHKSYYLDNWEHEVRENYYPISIDAYLLSLRSSGFTNISIAKYPEVDNLRDIYADYQIWGSNNRDLREQPCNLLLTATK